MSYILDAIQKLEQKRQQEELPNLFTLQNTMPRHSRRARWPYAVAGIVLLNGLTISSILWINPWRPAEPEPKKPPASLPSETKQVNPPAIHTPNPSPVPTQNNAGQPEILPAEIPVQPKPASPVQRQYLVQPSAPDKTLPETPPHVAKPAWPNSKLVAMQNLPENLKATIPELKMTVHSYDNHSPLRFAIINNRSLKEGEFLNPDLKLEKITPAGVILNYQGFKFILEIN